MQTLRHPVFLFCVFLFCINQGLELTENYTWLLHTHLDDLLCMPVVLTVALAIERAYFKNPAYIIPVHYTVGAVLAFSIIFELLLPFFSVKYTADALDIAMYAVGATVYHFTVNKPLA